MTLAQLKTLNALRRRKAAKSFECMECGRKMTLRQAENAVYGDGCPKCGGADIDEVTP